MNFVIHFHKIIKQVDFIAWEKEKEIENLPPTYKSVRQFRITPESESILLLLICVTCMCIVIIVLF